MHRLLLGVLLATILTGCSTQPSTTNSPTQRKEADVTITRTFSEGPGQLPAEQIEQKQAVITTEKGKIVIRFFADEAPLAVSNFVFLTGQKYFDGLTFHRREPGFVLQGGDPDGNGTGGPGYTFSDEPVTRTYTRGIVAMANRGPNTNGSQFFIMLADTGLPPQYTIFGEVTEGMDVVDQLEIGDRMMSVVIEDAA